MWKRFYLYFSPIPDKINELYSLLNSDKYTVYIRPRALGKITKDYKVIGAKIYCFDLCYKPKL